MNPPNDEMANDAAAANNNANKAATSNNEGSALGATIEAATPPTATARAITMASTLIAMSKLSLGLADGGSEDDSSAMAAVVDQNPRGEQKAATKDKKGPTKIRGKSKMLLSGTLFYSNENGERRHVIKGEWKLEPGKAQIQQSFELYRILHPFEFLDILPMSDIYKTLFMKGDSAGRDYIIEKKQCGFIVHLQQNRC